MRRLVLAILFTATFAACFDAPVERPPTSTFEVTDYSVLVGPKKVDILFLIDDSNSMEPKQNELKRRFPLFISRLEQLAQMDHRADYHIGVVTSDLGAAGIQCGRNLGGALQAKGNGADPSCQPPTDGVNFIEYNQIDGKNNLPAGQDLSTTFQCMASVGLNGCGYEHQLEAVYRALLQPPFANEGFLRDDALLAVVFVTDEDDCSAPPTSDLFSGPTALPPDGYGPQKSFRCTQFGIRCGDPPMSIPDGANAWSHCEPIPGGGKLFDVQRYIDLFTKPKGQGGIKADPARQVIVAAIAGDVDQGVTELLANPDTIPHQPCSTWNGSSCTWVLGHSCRSDTDTSWVGDPAVRIHSVVAGVGKSNFTSVCASNYQPALDQLADAIGKDLSTLCLDRPLADPANPDCVVEDHTPVAGQPDQIVEVPACARSNGATPCWRIVELAECDPVTNPLTNQPERIGLEIDRGGVILPAETRTTAECATVAQYGVR